MVWRLGASSRIRGASFLHYDNEANAYSRQMMDAAFGQDNFGNEIVWKRGTSRKNRRLAVRQYARHDFVLLQIIAIHVQRGPIAPLPRIRIQNVQS